MRSETPPDRVEGAGRASSISIFILDGGRAGYPIRSLRTKRSAGSKTSIARSDKGLQVSRFDDGRGLESCKSSQMIASRGREAFFLHAAVAASSTAYRAPSGVLFTLVLHVSSRVNGPAAFPAPNDVRIRLARQLKLVQK